MPDEAETISLLEEKLQVGKQSTVTERVVVKTTVSQHDEVVRLDLEREDVEVERVQIDRLVETAPAVREEGDWLIVPVVEEVLVVERRLRLREEVRIRRSRVVNPVSETFTLRREDVVIDRQELIPGALKTT